MNMRSKLFRCLCVLGLVTVALGTAKAGAPAEGIAGSPSLPPSGLTSMIPLPTKSPVQLFRHLLSLSPEEQDRELQKRSEASRVVLQRKLKDYQAMPVEERDAKLRALEFHHYFTFLLNAPASMQGPWLAAMPQEYRQLCEERLRFWSVLPRELQNYMLERRDTLQWLSRWEESTEAQRRALFQQLPPEKQAAIERDVARWQSMSPQDREKAWSSTRQMFELRDRDQKRVLAAIPETNRPLSAKLVQSLNQMPSPQREKYLEGWKKYSQLDPVQRARFIQSWERWSKMSESDREVWRRVARQMVPMPPPLPPINHPGSKPKSEA